MRCFLTILMNIIGSYKNDTKIERFSYHFFIIALFSAQKGIPAGYFFIIALSSAHKGIPAGYFFIIALFSAKFLFQEAADNLLLRLFLRHPKRHQLNQLLSRDLANGRLMD